MKHWSKKTVLIAALIAAMAIFMGCAVLALSTRKLKLDEYAETVPAWIDVDGQRHEAREVTRTVLSLQGLEQTPEQLAAKEWYEFCKTYDTDHSVYMASQGTFQAPEQYGAYGVYSQEMVDKLDALAEKYDLQLAGKRADAYSYDWQLGWDAIGLTDPIISGTDGKHDLRTCTFYASGNFVLTTDIHVTDPAFTWQYELSIVLHYHRKGVLNTNFLNLGNKAAVREWNYTRGDGQNILIIVSSDPEYSANNNVYLICDREDALLSAQFPPDYYPDPWDSTREEMTDADIEWLAEHIDFSIRPKVPDMDAVLPLLRKEDAAYDALLEQDDPFHKDSYNDLRKVLGAVTEFALLDLDGDGTEECIFWDGDQNPQLYTMTDGKTAPVVTEGEKAFGIQGALSLCAGNVLKTYEEVGQAYKLYCFYTVENGMLIPQNRLVYDIANDTWGLSLSGIHIDQTLTAQAAEALLASYTEVPLEHRPIDEFPEDQ